MQNRPQIRLLSDQVINKIAAGEVVERPASVLKELMENAIDAGATRLDVELVAGGRKLLAVSDNGCGMDRDNALLSIERHATSKIRDVDDIEHVGTLGFRGEALAAISSVSRFTLTTRPEAFESGTTVEINGGRLIDVSDAGCPAGTRIEVRNLFFNVPARRKFLRADRTELAHARQYFLVHALAHPEVSMTLTVDEREVYNLAAGTGLQDRICELYNREFFNGLRKVAFSAGDLEISGYAGLPQVSRKDRADQYIFVNGRPASAPIVFRAVNQAYQTLLPKGRYPVLFLFVEMDPGLVDVNVHPTKKEVRFRQPGELRDVLCEALTSALRGDSKQGIGGVAGRAPVSRPFSSESFSAAPRPVEKQMSFDRIRQTVARPSGAAFVPPPIRSGSSVVPDKSVGQKPVAVPEAEQGESWAQARVLGQVGGLYVLLEAQDGLILMDPHAAHERVLYEKFMNETVGGTVRTQGLLTPETVELQPGDAETVRRNLTLLLEMGFGVSEFGGDTFMVDALPAFLKQGDSRAVLLEVAHELDSGGRRGAGNAAREMVAQAACKAAVKQRDRLGIGEIEQLVADLAAAEMPYTCPHGRPTVIFMSFSELHRKFGRE